MKRLTTHRTRVIFIAIIALLTLGLFLIILFFKISSPFKVSIYNYESYLDKKIITKLKQNYSYHAFTNLDEFTRAINNEKAVAGVGSDYQIAQLILEKKLRKINFAKLFNNSKFNDSTQIKNLYPEIVNKHFDLFEKFIIKKIRQINPENFQQTNWQNISHTKFLPFIYYDKNNNILGFEIDQKEGIDHFYEFLIPYFIMDKMVVYNTDKTPNKFTERSNLKSNENFNDLESLNSWKDIIKTLVSKYKNPRVYWTNWFQDNAMIGQFYGYESLNKLKYFSKQNEWADINHENFKEIINDWVSLVKDATGESIKNSKTNKLATDGQELVSSIIEPINGKADVSIMYNGDALDAYYGEDNFKKLGNIPHIGFKRPKNTYMNIDAWIISRETSENDADNLLKILYENVIKGAEYSLQDIEMKYLKEVLNLILEDNKLKKDVIINELFIDKNMSMPKNIKDIKKDFFAEYFDYFREAFETMNLPVVNNFHSINYTPGFKNVKNFIEKWYFLNKNQEVDKTALEIFNPEFNKKINHRIYQPLDLNLKTKIIDYYFQKTKS